MENILSSKGIIGRFQKAEKYQGTAINLSQALLNRQYIIKKVNTDDSELKNFLFTLGCYEGEEVTVISTFVENYVISVKDARYSIDKELAQAIVI